MKHFVKKIFAIFSATAVLGSMITTASVANAADNVNSDVIGKKDYTISNPYSTVDWDTWKAYKGATHVHTNISDGDIDFPDMVEKYYAKGFDVLAITDHGTVNKGWSTSKSRHAIFAYQVVTHGICDGVSNSRAAEIANGVGRNGQKMLDLSYGIELNGACIKKVHVNSYFADAGDGDMAFAATWPESAVEKSHNAGGLSHINHVGEWSGGNDDVGVYDSKFISKFADLFRDYSSCLGMELVNTADRRTRNDRYLYDRTLMELAPEGRNIFGFCEDDAHDDGDIDRNAQYFMMPSNTLENVRTCMENGAFFACSKNSYGTLELDGMTMPYNEDYPSVTKVDVNQESDRISFNVNNATKARLVANGNVIDTIELDPKGDTATFDLNKYEASIGRYVRAYFTGPGGICYAQPFLLTSTAYKTATVQFKFKVSGTALTVKDSDGKILSPVNNDNYFILPAGDYTYSANCKGFVPIVDRSFTVTDAQIADGTQTKITVSMDDDMSDSAPFFYVPETIYLNPSTNSMNTFQYYVDRVNIKYGALTQSANDTVGNIFFSCADAKSVTISVDSSTVSSATGNSVNYVSGYTSTGTTCSTVVTSGVLKTPVTAGSGKLIKWTAEYTLADNSTKKVYAYSYAYAPCTDDIAAGMEQIHTYSTDVENNGIFWANGFRAVSGGSYNCLLNFFTAAAPVSNSSCSYFFAQSSEAGAEFDSNKHKSNAADEHSVVGGVGYVTVDSSRYTNLNQIPNLKIGMWQYSIDGDKGDDVTGNITQTVGSASENITDIKAGVGEIYSGPLNVENAESFVGNKSIVLHSYTCTGRGDRKNNNNYYLIVSADYVNKAQLRSTFFTAINKNYDESKYTSDSFNAYMAALENAGSVLGNPNSTQAQIDAAVAQLQTALINLARIDAPVIDRKTGFIYGLAEEMDSLDGIFDEELGADIFYEDGALGTGKEITVKYSNGKTENFILVIFGDLDGNGKVDANDSVYINYINLGIFDEEKLGKAAIIAADANHDGVINSDDEQLVIESGLKKAKVVQKLEIV